MAGTEEGSEKQVVTLDDPRALRALAHPARQLLVRELFGGRVLTATEAAELVGLSPSAVSHHLRALEKWGLAERAEASSDGRVRPWKGTGDTLDIAPSGGEAARAAVQPIVDRILGDLAGDLRAYMDTDQTDPWFDAYRGLAVATAWLTEDETRELGERIGRLVHEYDSGRTRTDRPDGSRETSIVYSILPASAARPSGSADERRADDRPPT